MRLGLVIDNLRPQRGGAERYLAGLCARLAARGHEVRVYCLDGEPPGPGVEIVPVQAGALTRAARERRFSERACARARSDGCAPVLGVRHVLDVDVYQPHGGTWAASVEARLRCERRPWRRAARQVAHRLSPKHRFFERADREVFARRPGLLTLAVSPLVREDVLARYGEHRPRVEVVWPAVERERIAAAAGERGRVRARLGLRATEPLLLFVAHDFELKGLAAAIEALARGEARRGGARLAVAGRDDPAPYAALARRLGAGDGVLFLGERRDVPELLAAADLLVHPTRYDPCALSTLEALAAGVPVVTTSRNGAAALLSGAAGVAVEEADDAAALAGAIDALLARGDVARSAAREGGRALGWDEHLARIEPLLLGTVSAARQGTAS